MARQSFSLVSIASGPTNTAPAPPAPTSNPLMIPRRMLPATAQTMAPGSSHLPFSSHHSFPSFQTIAHYICHRGRGHPVLAMVLRMTGQTRPTARARGSREATRPRLKPASVLSTGAQIHKAPRRLHLVRAPSLAPEPAPDHHSRHCRRRTTACTRRRRPAS